MMEHDEELGMEETFNDERNIDDDIDKADTLDALVNLARHGFRVTIWPLSDKDKEEEIVCKIHISKFHNEKEYYKAFEYHADLYPFEVLEPIAEAATDIDDSIARAKVEDVKK